MTDETELMETIAATPPAARLNTVFITGIFLILFFSAIKIAHEITIPLVLAFILKIVLQPALRGLEKVSMPKLPAVLIVLSALFICLVILGTALSGPAMSWATKLPDGMSRLEERLGFLSKPFDAAQKFMTHAETLTQSGPKVIPVSIEGNRLSDKLIAEVQAIVSILFTTVLILFFLLLSGDTFLRKLVEILPRFKDKRQAVDISQHIEKDISIYLVTITIMNLLVSVATGIVMYLCGIEDPVLWAAMAFILNYLPIIGPALGFGVFLFAGLLSSGSLTIALLPSILYLLIHTLESMFITPLLLAKRFTLNPVLVILSLVFWYWMWGLPGAILAMPMLAITKIICDRIQALNAIGHFLEG